MVVSSEILNRAATVERERERGGEREGGRKRDRGREREREREGERERMENCKAFILRLKTLNDS